MYGRFKFLSNLDFYPQFLEILNMYHYSVAFLQIAMGEIYTYDM